MTKLTEFFEGMAKAFNTGTLQDLKTILKLPTAVHIDTQVIVIKDAAQGLFVLNTFRDNLIRSDFDRVTFTMSDAEELRGGATKVIVEWVALSSSGVELTKADATYICDYSQELGWQISIIEFGRAKTTEQGQFLGGLPLV
ncbi:hypothetical protein [Algirhabdus cladophorae]|uniref:hypothetical protein n=1 Tax=Algirhabdus cladophorae TaxID=3377108 RepID=UPI003B84B57C